MLQDAASCCKFAGTLAAQDSQTERVGSCPVGAETEALVQDRPADKGRAGSEDRRVIRHAGTPQRAFSVDVSGKSAAD